MNLQDGISLSESLIVTIFSMGIVFVTLIVISLILSGFKLIFYKKEKILVKDKKSVSHDEKPDISEEILIAIATATVAYNESKSVIYDENIVAVITAAIVSNSESNIENLNIKSIKRI